MKHSLLLILILTFGCSNQKDIKEFEAILGKENSETLTYIVNDFESDVLKRKYPNISTKKAYNQFLKELSQNQTEIRQKVSEDSRNLFEKSNLKLEIYSVPDSIWIERDSEKLAINKYNNPTLKIKRKYLRADGTFRYGTSISSLQDQEPIDEDAIIIESHKNWNELNYDGRYSIALNAIANKSDFLNEYLKVRDASGIIDPKYIAERMLESKVDLNDYFIKRLIITEIVY
ncbi:hypothetical protein [Gelidibacter maritimus]|uniref:Uncharacterized protein n=1 Tax=Gelidibacter maritimus TaxID=2761487 RepID=A0A7W2M5Q8_9FLAO|nr:hypothetical protein [Gelidibacter maritimus]MBA6153189.1 hypothetical protein [Gelidibacter maritimus]